MNASVRPSCGEVLEAEGPALGTGQGRPEGPCIPPGHSESEGARPGQQANHDEGQRMVVEGEEIG